MLYREIIAVCSEIHTKHINTLCGQNVELLHVRLGGIVGIATGRSGDRILVEARFSAPVQTGPEAHPSSYKIGTGSLSRG
jgi:hypothetical protein